MKKFTAVFFVTVLFFSFFNSSAYAHPGRTDSDGGHYDHSTGEYHYHNSGYSYNDREDEGLERIVAALSGELDGSFQKKYDLVYSTSRVKGYNDALKNFSLNTPIFNYLVQSNKLDYFVLSSYSISEARYEDTRSDYLYGYGFDYRSAKNKYIETYNNYYDSVVYVPEAFKSTSEGIEAYENGYSDGYASFDTFVSQYKKHSPIKAFFVLLKTYQIVLLSLLSFFVLSLIVFAILSRKFSINRSKVYDENISKPKTPQISSSVNTNNNISKRKITPPKKLTLELSNIKLLPQYAESIIYPIGEEPEDVFRARYTGVPISSFLKLPYAVHYIDKDGNIEFSTSEKDFDDYTIYIAEHGSVLHRDKWCSNSYYSKTYFYLTLPPKHKNYPRCKRCFSYVPGILLNDEWFSDYKKILFRKFEYGIDGIPPLNETTKKLFSKEEKDILYNKRTKKKTASKIPPANSSKFSLTISKMMHELATKNVKPYKMYCIGKDISAGTLYFAPADKSIRSFFESGDEICHISQKNQRFFFTDGEIIYLYNCDVSTEEFK